MKIRARVADDERPKGWFEDYELPEAKTEPEAAAIVCALVLDFNAQVRPPQKPRRIKWATYYQDSEPWPAEEEIEQTSNPRPNNYANLCQTHRRRFKGPD